MADWKSTLNLPRTAFPMKASLQKAEPDAIARWEAMDLNRTELSAHGITIEDRPDGTSRWKR